MLQLPLNIQLNDSAQFNNFFAGENFQLIDKLTGLCESQSDFIYIWGASGVGKSHLAQATCNLFAHSDKTVAYFPVDDPVISIDFLENLESVDLICIDGFEAIAGKNEWQEALFNLYNQLKLFNRQLIIFSRLSPKQLTISLQDLKSRLGAMEIYKLVAISDQQKIDYLMEYGQSRGLSISTDVANFIIARTDREVSAIQSMIKLLDQQALTHKRKITIPFVKNILGL